MDHSVHVDIPLGVTGYNHHKSSSSSSFRPVPIVPMMVAPVIEPAPAAFSPPSSPEFETEEDSRGVGHDATVNEREEDRGSKGGERIYNSGLGGENVNSGGGGGALRAPVPVAMDEDSLTDIFAMPKNKQQQKNKTGFEGVKFG